MPNSNVPTCLNKRKEISVSYGLTDPNYRFSCDFSFKLNSILMANFCLINNNKKAKPKSN